MQYASVVQKKDKKHTKCFCFIKKKDTKTYKMFLFYKKTNDKIKTYKMVLLCSKEGYKKIQNASVVQEK